MSSEVNYLKAKISELEMTIRNMQGQMAAANGRNDAVQTELKKEQSKLSNDVAYAIGTNKSQDTAIKAISNAVGSLNSVTEANSSEVIALKNLKADIVALEKYYTKAEVDALIDSKAATAKTVRGK